GSGKGPGCRGLTGRLMAVQKVLKNLGSRVYKLPDRGYCWCTGKVDRKGGDRDAFGRRWPAHARARGPVAVANRGRRREGSRVRGPSRYRIVAKILFKFGSRSELRLYAVFESYAYMPFSSPTPICRFRVLRLYAVFESYAYMPFSSPTPIRP